VGRVPNLKRALEALREHGYWSIGADADGASLYEMDARSWEGPIVYVLGAEDRGLRQGVRDAVDFRVGIPMLGQVESLNVSTAAAVLLFEGVRRAGAAKAFGLASD
jgi:23S rRNA (guanosine2251-2'-O)-methyltransferase